MPAMCMGAHAYHSHKVPLTRGIYYMTGQVFCFLKFSLKDSQHSYANYLLEACNLSNSYHLSTTLVLSCFLKCTHTCTCWKFLNKRYICRKCMFSDTFCITICYVTSCYRRWVFPYMPTVLLCPSNSMPFQKLVAKPGQSV